MIIVIVSIAKPKINTTRVATDSKFIRAVNSPRLIKLPFPCIVRVTANEGYVIIILVDVMGGTCRMVVDLLYCVGFCIIYEYRRIVSECPENLVSKGIKHLNSKVT